MLWCVRYQVRFCGGHFIDLIFYLVCELCSFLCRFLKNLSHFKGFVEGYWSFLSYCLFVLFLLLFILSICLFLVMRVFPFFMFKFVLKCIRLMITKCVCKDFNPLKFNIYPGTLKFEQTHKV